MNNNLLSNFIALAAGAAIGSVVTWKLVENKYKQIAEEEIASVKEVYARKYKQAAESDEDRSNDVMVASRYDNKPDIQEYAAMVAGYGYVSENDEPYYDDPEDDEEEEDEDDYPTSFDDRDKDDFVGPQVISPEEFDENGYETFSFTYYADGVLTDEEGNIVYDLENTVGADFYKHFGEYEDDSVFVRNDWLEYDYEILRDERCYSDVYPGE